MRRLSVHQALEIERKAREIITGTSYENIEFSYSFADEIIEDDQDSEGKQTVDDEIGVVQVIFNVVRIHSQVFWMDYPGYLTLCEIIFWMLK